ncbi:MAG: hypothetical protein U9N40_07070 [Euryarchaeota archaeon]|nr:hypothetical protein [Euryarchaeota archaeon]
MNDLWLEKLLKNPDLRARLYVWIVIIQICAIASVFFGMVILMFHILGII